MSAQSARTVGDASQTKSGLSILLLVNIHDNTEELLSK